MFWRAARRRWKRKQKIDEETMLRIRFIVLRGAIVLSFLVLIGQLWRMQIVEGSLYQQRAEHNRLRILPLPAPRGVIYDRNRNLLVRNIPSFTVSIVPADLPEKSQSEVVSRLGTLLKMDAGIIDRMVSERRVQRRLFVPVPIKTNVDQNTAFDIEERHPQLPGVMLEIEPIRQYIDGPITSPILGYLGRISDTEYDELNESGYSLNDRLGKMGVEYTYEESLRGKFGREQVEVDVSGRKVSAIDSDLPVPGNNLVLSIDVDLQRKMYEYLSESLEDKNQYAAAVAMNPQTGEILGMVSLPAYDNNLFAGGISQKDLDSLLNDPRRPLLNHAISGLEPPGSIFKLINGAAALQEGIARESTVINCPGVIYIPNQYDPRIVYPFPCYQTHGSLNMTMAIALSCDVYFYELAGGYPATKFKGLGPDLLSNYSKAFGLGAKTGVDLSGEDAGVIPSPEWKLKAKDEEWLLGDTYHMAIGQGDVLVTPLEMLDVVAAVANRGTLVRPQVVKEIIGPSGETVRKFQPEIIRKIDVSKENLEVIRNGMRTGVNYELGTSRFARVPGVQVAGKTGTAEWGTIDPKTGSLQTHGWFVAFAPYDNPTIAIVVFQQKGQGMQTASPVGGKILNYYFSKYPPA